MITTFGLTKSYGTRVALRDVDLAVADGAVYGLVGPNGAGKTTLLGILAGLRMATSGHVRIDAERRDIAVLPDTPRFDPWLTGREVVSLAKHMVAPDSPEDRVLEVLHEAGLGDAVDTGVGGYSRGMLQRLGVAATIVGHPRVLLLDEPASALDPRGRRDVLDLVVRMRGTATVLFSSHILGDVQEVSDTVGVLDDGRLRYQGPLASLLTGAAAPGHWVRLRPPVGPVAQRLRDHDWVCRVEQRAHDVLVVRLTDVSDADRRLPAALLDAGARVRGYGPEEASLEQAFLRLTRADNEDGA